MANLQLLESLFSGLVHPTTGALLASAQVSFFNLGTLTPQTVYSDSLGASPITPPLILTAGGVGTVYTANPCRVQVKSADGLTTIYDIANANSSVPASQFITSTSWNGGTQTTLQTIFDAYTTAWGGAAGYWKYKYDTGATERNPKDVLAALGISPQDFGAVGDGVADDTTPFLSLATAQAATGLPVYIPSGTYQLTSVITFGNDVKVTGAGRTETFLRGTNGTMNCLVFGTGAILADFAISHSTSSTGRALTVNGGARLTGIVSSGFFRAADNDGGVSYATISSFTGSSIALDGIWRLDSSVTVSGTASSVSYAAATATVQNLFFSTSTTDVANGGNATPAVTTVAAVIAAQRIRGTSAGAATVNPTGTPTNTILLILECYNNSGGAFTFTLDAEYHSAGNPAPANGSRVTVAFMYNITESVWREVGRATTT